jgi:histidyl-tRNA synthetase
MEIASNSKYCIIVAPKELESSKVVLRNMNDGTETQIEIEKITDDPKSILNLETL